MNFDAFISEILRNGWAVHGVQLYQSGVLLHQWGDVSCRYPIYSVTKSLLSIAVGIARDEGRLRLDRCVLDYLPGRFLTELSAEQRKAFAPLTLLRLMTMSVDGLPFRPEGDSYLRFSLNCPIENPNEPRFHYSNIPACLTGAALTEALGEDAGAFLQRRVLEPLGIFDAEMARCPDGYFYGASGMKLSVDELSRIGLMLCQGGVYQGRRIVSEEYLALACSALQPNREDGYGLFFWKYRDGFSLNGKWGQKCFVFPKEGTVIAFLADMKSGSGQVVEAMERALPGGCPV